MMRYDTLNWYDYGSYTKMIDLSSNVHSTDEDKSKRIIMHKNLSQNCSANKDESKQSIVNETLSQNFSVDHRWELPVLRYHSIRIIYNYPFSGVIFSVILHDFIRQITIKSVISLPFFLIMVIHLIFLINYHILYFHMYFQYFFFLQKSPNNVSKTFKIL